MVQTKDQSLLFPQLLEIELRHRLAHGEHLTMSDYEKPFPDPAAAIPLMKQTRMTVPLQPI